jgi:DNA-binding FadR family transcriptional regulator
MKNGPVSEDLFQPIKKFSRSSDLLAEELCRVIVEGKVKPGDSLPSERTLAERFNVTRNVVREALRSLEKYHLLSVRQGSRITVLDYLTTAGFDFVAELLASSEDGVRSLMCDIAEARGVIGGAMMFHAVDRMKAELIPDIEGAVDALAEEAGKPKPDMRTLQQLDFEIQNRLMRAGGNQVMILLHNSIRHIYERTANLFEPIMARPEVLVKRYRRIMGHLKDGNRKKAKEVFLAIFDEGSAALSESG